MMSWLMPVVFSTVAAVACQRFPAGFQFGVATSAYQVEGAWNASDKSPSVWDEWTQRFPRAVADGGSGEVACDSYHRWREDIKILKDLGVDFYRFSISWPRLLPTGFPNQVSEAGARYYGDLIDALLRHGIRPYVTIYHWDLPLRLHNMGGWHNPLIVDWYTAYARVVFSLFGDRVRTWLTINEPLLMCDVTSHGWGPGTEDPEIGLHLCARHVLLAHARAFRMYQEEFKEQQGGKLSIANQMIWYEPDGPGDEDLTELVRQYMIGRYTHPIYSARGGWPPAVARRVAASSRAEGHRASRLPPFTQEEIELIRGSYDFCAVNHYTSQAVRGARPGSPPPRRSPLAAARELRAATAGRSPLAATAGRSPLAAARELRAATAGRSPLAAARELRAATAGRSPLAAARELRAATAGRSPLAATAGRSPLAAARELRAATAGRSPLAAARELRAATAGRSPLAAARELRAATAGRSPLAAARELRAATAGRSPLAATAGRSPLAAARELRAATAGRSPLAAARELRAATAGRSPLAAARELRAATAGRSPLAAARELRAATAGRSPLAAARELRAATAGRSPLAAARELRAATAGRSPLAAARELRAATAGRSPLAAARELRAATAGRSPLAAARELRAATAGRSPLAAARELRAATAGRSPLAAARELRAATAGRSPLAAARELRAATAGRSPLAAARELRAATAGRSPLAAARELRAATAGRSPLAAARELRAATAGRAHWPRADNMWLYVYPEGLRSLLRWLKRSYGALEVVITESGYATSARTLEDDDRLQYYRGYMEQVLLAIEQDGVNVTGYTAWSLMDNFEWTDGYKSKFGIYDVDFSDPQRRRRARKSALFYRDVIRTRSLAVPEPHLKDEL